MSFEIHHETGPEACVVHISGDIDIAVVPELREGLESALQSGCRNVVLDLSKVVYADSSALGMLVWLDHRLTPLEGRMFLAGANHDITRILELSGLVQVAGSVSMSPSVDSALEGLEMVHETVEPLWVELISLPARVDALAHVRERVFELASGLGLSEGALFDLKVAVGEAAANAVRHGSASEGDDVDVEVSAFDDRVVVKVTDRGCGFDGVHACDSNLYAPGGRGVMFMRALMDRVDFEPLPEGGTVVTLVKHRGNGHS